MTDEWATDSMPTVAYLRVNGMPPIRTDWDEATHAVVWVFPNTVEVQKLVSEYNDGKAIVDLRSYNRAFAQTKREMFDQHPEKQVL